MGFNVVKINLQVIEHNGMHIQMRDLTTDTAVCRLGPGLSLFVMRRNRKYISRCLSREGIAPPVSPV